MNCKQTLQTKGYVLIKNVLDPSEVRKIRSELLALHKEKGSHLTMAEISQLENTIKVPFSEKVNQSLSSLLGDYLIYNCVLSQGNCHNYIPHRDSQRQGELEYLYDKDYLVYKCGIYLQDNSSEWGGGLDVKPGSHRPTLLGARFPISRKKQLGKISRIQRCARDYRDSKTNFITLNSKPGDLLVFHANLIHCPSKAAADKKLDGYTISNVPDEKYKILLSWEISGSNDKSKTYKEHLISRAMDETGENNRIFNNASSFSISDHSKEVKELINNQRLNVVDLKDD